jgi:hypothetical protein
MAVEIITKDDLNEFRVKLLAEIREMLGVRQVAPARFIKGKQVRDLLSISPGTLQNLRINGTLKFTKVGSIIYYNTEDVHKLLEGTDRR